MFSDGRRGKGVLCVSQGGVLCSGSRQCSSDMARIEFGVPMFSDMNT